MSATATRAPCRAKVSAAARPIPEPAPVISTVRSAKGIVVLLGGDLRHAVDVQDGAGDVMRLLRDQVGDRGCHVLRLAELSERHPEAEGLRRALHEARAQELVALGA